MRDERTQSAGRKAQGAGRKAQGATLESRDTEVVWRKKMSSEQIGEIKVLFEQAIDLLDSGSHLIFSDKVFVPRKELVSILQQLRQAIPQEVERANDILKEKENILLRAQSDADVIVLQAKAKADEIAKSSQEERIRLLELNSVLCEAEDYVKELHKSTEAECQQIRDEAVEYASQAREDIDRYRNDILGSSKQYFDWLEQSFSECLKSVRDNSSHIREEMELLRLKQNR